MEELGGAEVEADESVLAVGASEQNDSGLLAALRRPMENSMEKSQLKVYTPGVTVGGQAAT